MALIPCPDCKRDCSTKAEHCPQCGRFFQRFGGGGEVTVDKRGWATVIVNGIVLGWVAVVLLTGFLFFLLLTLGVGLSVPSR